MQNGKGVGYLRSLTTRRDKAIRRFNRSQDKIFHTPTATTTAREVTTEVRAKIEDRETRRKPQRQIAALCLPTNK